MRILRVGDSSLTVWVDMVGSISPQPVCFPARKIYLSWRNLKEKIENFPILWDLALNRLLVLFLSIFENPIFSKTLLKLARFLKFLQRLVIFQTFSTKKYFSIIFFYILKNFFRKTRGLKNLPFLIFIKLLIDDFFEKYSKLLRHYGASPGPPATRRPLWRSFSWWTLSQDLVNLVNRTSLRSPFILLAIFGKFSFCLFKTFKFWANEQLLFSIALIL